MCVGGGYQKRAIPPPHIHVHIHIQSQVWAVPQGGNWGALQQGGGGGTGGGDRGSREGMPGGRKWQRVGGGVRAWRGWDEGRVQWGEWCTTSPPSPPPTYTNCLRKGLLVHGTNSTLLSVYIKTLRSFHRGKG